MLLEQFARGYRLSFAVGSRSGVGRTECGWSLLGRVARWFLEGNSTSHMTLHFHVLEEGVVESTVKLQFGPVADDMLEGGKPAIYGFMMAVM